MPTLGEVKRVAVDLFRRGETLQALRLYDCIVAAHPHDFEARIKVADCLIAANEHKAAFEVYRAVAWYALKSGHPLASVVVARVLESLQEDASDILATLVVRYGSESELVGKRAARINLPMAGSEVPVVDITQPPPSDVHQAAAE